jgi:predicted dithiol-disulfide oxidoreductase (DUF899 family)
MAFPEVTSRDEWLVARRDLLAAEKEATRARDALNARRRALPMVEIDKEYVFEGPDGGKAGLPDLFDGRRQLIVYHFMFGPDWGDDGCPSCSFLVDNLGHLGHLRARDTNLVVVSRAPQSKIAPFKERMSWTFPWLSSFGSDFNYDFHATLDEAVAPIEYNYRDKAELTAKTPWHTNGEQHGLSVFFHDGDRVFHTYSTYGRGPDLLLGTYNYLDLTPLGRQEEGTGIGNFKLHYKYDD